MTHTMTGVLHFWLHPKIPMAIDALKKAEPTPCLRNGHPTKKCLRGKLLISETTTWSRRELWMEVFFCLNWQLVMVFLHIFPPCYRRTVFASSGEDDPKILSKHLSISSKYHMIYPIYIWFYPFLTSLLVIWFLAGRSLILFEYVTFSNFPSIWMFSTSLINLLSN